jgi:hypothetical protein
MRAAAIGLISLAGISIGSLFVIPPVTQDPTYHAFADRRTFWGVPNFWNVVSNAAFLGVAAAGLRALRNRQAFTERWEGVSFRILLAGTALVGIGSGWYHLRPNDQTLFWDRLPMTIVFMSLLASIIGERVDMRAGRLVVAPLLAIGVASVVYWRMCGDLRPYVVVQFYPVLAIPFLLLTGGARYTGAVWTWLMAALYVAAKALELFDERMAHVLPVGGHPLKHVVAAAAIGCYVVGVGRRRSLNTVDTACGAEALSMTVE